jgi:hypothetical protein
MPMQKYFSTVQKKFSVTFEISDSRCKGASQRDLRFKGSKGSPKLSRAAKTLACINLRDIHLEQKSYFFNEIYALQEEHKCVFHDHILCPTLKDAHVVLPFYAKRWHLFMLRSSSQPNLELWNYWLS